VIELDQKISEMRLNGLKGFKKGILGVKNLKAWEYVDLAFYFPHALSEIKLPLDKIIAVFKKILVVYNQLRRGTYTVDTLQQLVKHFGELQKAFEASGLNNLCKSKLKLVKFHDLTHHPMAVMLYEDPQSYSTEVGELLNRLYVKEIYLSGNKHDNTDFIFRKGAEIAACELLQQLKIQKKEKRWKKSHWITRGKAVNIVRFSKSKNLVDQLFYNLLPKYLDAKLEKLYFASSMWISNDKKTRQRIVALNNFLGWKRVDIVAISNEEEEEWYAEVVYLFQARSSDGVQKDGMMIRWTDLSVDQKGNKVLTPINKYQLIELDCVIEEVLVVRVKKKSQRPPYHYHVDQLLRDYRTRM